MADHNLIFPFPLFMSFFLLPVAVLAGPVTGAVVSFDQPELTLMPGEVATVNLILDRVPAGMSGYAATFSVEDPQVGEITEVTLPEWAVLSDIDGVPGPEVSVIAIDLQGDIEGYSEIIVLATLSVKGLAAGTTEVVIDDPLFEDDEGNEIAPILSSLSVTIVTRENLTPPTTLPAISMTNTATPGTSVATTTVMTTTTANPGMVTTVGAGGGSTPYQVSEKPTTVATVTGSGGAMEQNMTTTTPVVPITTVPETTKPDGGNQGIPFITVPGILLLFGALILLGIKLR
jgi:hypothetical protein